MATSSPGPNTTGSLLPCCLGQPSKRMAGTPDTLGDECCTRTGYDSVVRLHTLRARIVASQVLSASLDCETHFSASFATSQETAPTARLSKNNPLPMAN